MDYAGNRRNVRYGAMKGDITVRTDSVVTEVPLTVHLNNEEVATLLSSPHRRKELVVGFLASEGFIKQK